jgi:predicted amidophosphoribosyltransferase
MVAAGAPAADAVTWVPLARRRLAERGYDQARALAIAVGARLDLPVVRLTRRAVATAPQARRPGEERRKAMRGAFEPLAHPSVPARVLLVDDVLTTGATAAACAEALTTSGVRDVALLTAARAFAGKGPGEHAGEHRGYTRSGSQPGLWLPGEPPR